MARDIKLIDPIVKIEPPKPRHDVIYFNKEFKQLNPSNWYSPSNLFKKIEVIVTGMNKSRRVNDLCANLTEISDSQIDTMF